ncbi:MAG: hypothetical protein HC773_05195 [Scytonema sp. CRU_2_7]|nr:hypothetical protein [Scytonema sp. CRU_2_7]
MIVRELITKLGFVVDESALRGFDSKIGSIQKNMQGLTGNLQKVATGIRNVGLGLARLLQPHWLV